MGACWLVAALMEVSSCMRHRDREFSQALLHAFSRDIATVYGRWPLPPMDALWQAVALIEPLSYGTWLMEKYERHSQGTLPR